MDKGICRNDRCRGFGVDRVVYLGDWFVSDLVLCPFCGEAMETAFVVGNGVDWRPDRPAPRPSLAMNRVPIRGTR
jgi:hypothetical protein